MALTFMMEFPGLTQQQYNQILDRLQPDRRPFQGELLHVAGPMEGGWSVVEIWESQDAFDRFIQEKMVPVLQEAGVRPSQPKVVPVYNIMAREKITT